MLKIELISYIFFVFVFFFKLEKKIKNISIWIYSCEHEMHSITKLSTGERGWMVMLIFILLLYYEAKPNLLWTLPTPLISLNSQ